MIVTYLKVFDKFVGLSGKKSFYFNLAVHFKEISVKYEETAPQRLHGGCKISNVIH